MSDLTRRLDFDATRCELFFSKGIATNIQEAVKTLETCEAVLRAIVDYCDDREIHSGDLRFIVLGAAKRTLKDKFK